MQPVRYFLLCFLTVAYAWRAPPNPRHGSPRHDSSPLGPMSIQIPMPPLRKSPFHPTMQPLMHEPSSDLMGSSFQPFESIVPGMPYPQPMFSRRLFPFFNANAWRKLYRRTHKKHFKPLLITPANSKYVDDADDEEDDEDEDELEALPVLVQKTSTSPATQNNVKTIEVEGSPSYSDLIKLAMSLSNSQKRVKKKNRKKVKAASHIIITQGPSETITKVQPSMTCVPAATTDNNKGSENPSSNPSVQSVQMSPVAQAATPVSFSQTPNVAEATDQVISVANSATQPQVSILPTLSESEPLILRSQLDYGYPSNLAYGSTVTLKRPTKVTAVSATRRMTGMPTNNNYDTYLPMTDESQDAHSVLTSDLINLISTMQENQLNQRGQMTQLPQLPVSVQPQTIQVIQPTQQAQSFVQPTFGQGRFTLSTGQTSQQVHQSPLSFSPAPRTIIKIANGNDPEDKAKKYSYALVFHQDKPKQNLLQ